MSFKQTHFNKNITKLGAITLLALLFPLASTAVAAPLDTTHTAPSATLQTQLKSCAIQATTKNIEPTNWLDQDPLYDQIVIDFDDSMPNSEAEAIGKKWGLNLKLNSKYSDDANIFIATVPEGTVPAYQECMKGIDGIEGIEENYEMKAFGVNTPNDPLYPFQWNFKQVNAEKAWETSTGKDVTVAVIDTGVALEDDPSRNIVSMKDLAETNYVQGYDFVDDDDFAWDGHGHGTHVAGTIAQSTNNAYGVAGLAYNANIMPLRVLNNEGYGSVTDIADAIRYAADNGAQVINMSLGGPLPSMIMARAVKYAHSKGVTIVAAAGNSGRREASYPAAYNHVIAVAATQYDRSTTFYSQSGAFVDIAAPGGNTRVDQNGDGRPDGVMQETLKQGRPDQHEFALYMGTSMASPHVAAVAALVIAEGITNPDRVEEILKSTASQSERNRFNNEKEYKERYGAGIVQADAAVSAAKTTPSLLRLLFATALAIMAFGASRRRDNSLFKLTPSATFISTLLFASAGLFFLPSLLGNILPSHSLVVELLSTPFEGWDTVLFGPHTHQNPLLASALLPLAAAALLGTQKRRRQQFVAGLSLGMAAYCLTSAILLNADVAWIPGTGLLDRAWLGFNAAFSALLGFLAIRRN